MTTWKDIEKIVNDTRHVHEGLLRSSGIEGTSGTCLHGSFVLREFLAKFGNCTAVVRGGDGEGDGGARDATGTLRGHYWVEGVTSDGITFVADITADQFGHDPVYFAEAAAARDRYLPGDDAIVARTVVDFGRSIRI